jgi:Uma2 family endonuclease
MATTEILLTAEEYSQLPDNDYPTELVRGRVIAMNIPSFRHGKVCARIARLLGNYIDEHDLGHVLTNDSGVITERDPDTVRGPDVSFYSYVRVPTGSEPAGYPDVVPEIAIEVRSPTDRWPKILKKVSEYLTAGIDAVYVVDAQTQSVVAYTADQASVTLRDDDELTFPKPLEGLRIAVRRVFAP